MTGSIPPTPDGQHDLSEDPRPASALLTRLRTFPRVRDGRVVAGVCAGIGARLGIDPVVLRILLAVLTITNGAGLVLYLTAWLLLPDEGTGRSLAERFLGRQNDRSTGVVITVVVVLGLVASAVMAPWNAGFAGPLLAILVVVGLVMLSRRDGAPTSGTNTASTAASSPLVDNVHAPEWGAPVTQPSHEPTSPLDNVGADDATRGTEPESPPAQPSPQPIKPDTKPQSWTQHAAATVPASFWDQPDPLGLQVEEPDHSPEPMDPTPSTQPRKPRSLLFPITLGVVAVALMPLLLLVGTGSSVPSAAWVAIPLGVIGLGLLVGTWYGRAGGLIALGTVLTLLLPTLAIMDAWLGPTWADSRTTQVGDQQLRVTDLDGLRSSYEHGVGPFTLDLRDLEGPAGYERDVTVEQASGELNVRVPDDVDVVVNATVALGSLEVLSQADNQTDNQGGNQGGNQGDNQASEDTTPGNHSGWSIQVDEARYDAEGPSNGELRLNLDMGMGAVEVSRG